MTGAGRVGKTSLKRSLQGEKYDSACKSTAGIDVHNVDVKELGVDITSVSVKGKGKPWKKVVNEGSEANRALQARILTKGLNRVETEREAFERLLSKYKFGEVSEEEEQEDFPHQLQEEVQDSLTIIPPDNTSSNVAAAASTNETLQSSKGKIRW